MNCEQSRQYMSEYLDGVLTAETQKNIEAHLAQCEYCRREVEELKAAIAWLQQAKELQPPADLRQNVLRKLQSEAMTRKPSWSKGVLLQFTAAAAVFLILVCGNVLPFSAPMPDAAPQDEAITMNSSRMLQAAESASDAQGMTESEAEIFMDSGQESVVVSAEQDIAPPKVAAAPEKEESETTVYATTRPSWRLWLNLFGIPVFLVLLWRLMIERKRCREQ